MGNNNSSNSLSTDLIETTTLTNDDTFKVDNINSYGRKHASAKIQLSTDSLCIRQKHRQSLHIPLDTIKRYGLDGSIFILECGRRAPLGQARYAFRCKQAHRLVDCLDQRITMISKQLLEQRRGTMTSSSSTLTNVSSTSHHHHHRRRRTQSDQGLIRRAPSSILVSSTSSLSISLTSAATFSDRNSEPNLTENYLPFDSLPCHIENNNHNEEGQFIAKLKQPVERSTAPDLNYLQFTAESVLMSTDDKAIDLRPESETIISLEEADIESIKEPLVQQPRKRALLSLFNHHHPKFNKSRLNNQNNSTPATASALIPSSTMAPYVYLDHEKTTTLKEIAEKRLQQQHSRRIEV